MGESWVTQVGEAFEGDGPDAGVDVFAARAGLVNPYFVPRS